MVVTAHRQLYELGVLHRDISGGNILIRVIAAYVPPPRNGKAKITIAQPKGDEVGGFLTDFELASVKEAEEQLDKKPGDTISVRTELLTYYFIVD